MINDLRRPETSPRGPEARPRPAPERSAYASLIQDLVWLRKLVLERLTSIETLAGQRPASAPSRAGTHGAGRVLEDSI